jgi:hypothetical protein
LNRHKLTNGSEHADAARPRRRREGLLDGLFWLAFAGLAYGLSGRFGQPILHYELGASGWPRGIILLIAIGGLGMLLSALGPALEDARGRDPDPAAPAVQSAGEAPDEAAAAPGRARNVRRLFVFGLPIVYVIAMQWVGFLLVSPLFLIAYMWLFGYRRWGTVLAVNAAIYGFVLVVFVKLLYTPFPQGVGRFHSLNGQYIHLIR